MKCLFCGAEMLPGKDKCDNCGNYQHNAGINNRRIEENQTVDKSNSKRNIILFFGIIIIIVIISLSVLFVVNYLNKEVFYGNWHCPNEKINIDIDKNKIIVDYNQSEKDEIEYIIDSVQENKNIIIYYLKDIKGLSTDDAKYVITIDNDAKDIMKFKDENDNYTCYRNK